MHGQSDNMDDKGFIFTIDASLALIVVFVLTASIVAYGALPVYQGQEHQHLEALASSALEILEQNGELRYDAVAYASGNSTLILEADNRLNSSLGTLIPEGIAYRITVGSSPNAHVVQNTTGTRNLLTSNDIVTKVKVISGPQEGWMGRAYYKLEHVEFRNQTDTTITTLWNFHNYLQNFGPWGNRLDNYNYWGGTNPTGYNPPPQSAVPIKFNVPSSGTINWGKFLLGSADAGHTVNRRTVYSGFNANLLLNTVHNYNINSANFDPLYTGSSYHMFNYLGNIPATDLINGNNTFYLDFDAYSSQKLPWFALIGSYQTTIRVPQGVITDTANCTDIAGVGHPTTGNSLTYDLNTGTVTSTTSRSITLGNYEGHDYNVNTPFALTNIPKINSGSSGPGSAVARTMDVYYPNGMLLYDSYVVINAFGGVDGALVEVKDAEGNWHTVFNSYDFTYRNDGGYGNIPGILNIKDYLREGHNTVRVTIWDDSINGDYDLVGLTSCYAKITYSGLPIRWDTIPFDSYQYNYGTASQSKTFSVTNESDNKAQEALLFVGTGIDTRNITVTINNGTYTKQIYKGAVPYVLDLGTLDRQTTPYVLTETDEDGNVTIKGGTYTLTLTVTPGLAYESGDGSTSPPSYGGYANPEIFSGTRISIIYPKFLANIWANAYANSPEDAKELAKDRLIANLTGYTINRDNIKAEAIWTGDMPNAVPVRLELWKQ